jgi:ABC-2 type transporter
MKNKTLKQLLPYEFKNIVLGNFFIIFFGVIFPIFLFSIITIDLGSIPQNYREIVKTTMFLTVSSIIPLSVMFIGHSAIYGNELEKDIPLRLELFGFNKLQLLFSKYIIYFIFITLSLILYSITGVIIGIKIPTLSIILVSIVVFYILSVLLLLLSNSIALIFKKFGITYGITMILYFFMMFTSGMMGVRTEKLPGVLKIIGQCFPTYHISDSYYKFWLGSTYNFMPLIVSFLIFTSIALILFITGIYVNKKRGI